MISLKRYGSSICLEILLVHRCNLLQRGLQIGPIQRNGAAPEQKRTEGYIIVSTQASNQKVQTGCPFVKVCKTFSHFFTVFTDVTLTHLLLLLESLLSVMSSFVFTLLLFTLKKLVIWCMVSL